MEGELWVDVGQQRMVKLDAHLVSDVNFGWGVVGQLFKGGTILVEQKGCWRSPLGDDQAGAASLGQDTADQVAQHPVDRPLG